MDTGRTPPPLYCDSLGCWWWQVGEAARTHRPTEPSGAWCGIKTFQILQGLSPDVTKGTD
jgi:hypothetical protein